ncbi:nuclear transport factor 2 family protein [Gordonia sp. ABSL1-1]|uniref:nuclear transport factor 2 family protein n=1 Tax=Gordonia sp. ABSL1-1 TaxID=3053923 RepID=UPI00257453DF|nr:nuclear transport factor 2 family protein [Gordonia sp. ABSL1-1]MDL9936879.1 nuclear transport factor 2 family protein [Gordonia sp. ABSL1-1]
MSEHTTPATEVVDSFFANFGAGDTDALLDLFADDADFRVNGADTVPWSGTRSGRAEIGEFFDVLGKVLTPPELFEVTGRVADAGDVVVFARAVFGVRATGKTFDNAYALHFGVDDGRIVRYHMYEDSHAIAEAFVAD